ncbi:MAG: holo-ACP synthase [Phycisphaerales bacterium]|nr:holo-ACP synthase [Phycisphaerales bacterium]
MNVVAHGVDLVECRRIGELVERHRERFFERMFTPIERERIDRLREPIPHISGRFAAKEAILKVLGTGWRGQIAWTDMEITNDQYGAPHVALSGECARVAAERGIGSIILSISHTQDAAMASALGLGDK